MARCFKLISVKRKAEARLFEFEGAIRLYSLGMWRRFGSGWPRPAGEPDGLNSATKRQFALIRASRKTPYFTPSGP